MNKTAYKIFLLSGWIIFAQQIQGQASMSARDSVAIAKPKKNRSLYIFENNGSKEIQIVNSKIEFIRFKPNPVLRDIGNDALTTLTGIGFGSSSDARWKFSGNIQCNDTLHDWEINLCHRPVLTTVLWGNSAIRISL
jgi:hypothetical protein